MTSNSLVWRKSTFSSPNPDCVEVAQSGDTTHVRDTKDHGTGPVLSFNPTEWAAFVAGVRAGEFD
jgi:hypothetical protein